MTILLQLLLGGILVGGVYASLALGFVVIYKTAGVFNMAYGQFAMLGAYVAWTFMGTHQAYAKPLAPGLSLPVPVALVLTLLFAVVFGLAVERGIFRRMIGRSMAMNFIVTLGLLEIITGLVVILWGTEAKNYPDFMPKGVINIGSISLAKEYLVAFVVAIILVGSLIFLLQRTKTGLGMRAAFEQQVVARSLGISAKRNAQIAWVLCTLLATSSGILIASVMSVNVELSQLVLVALGVVLMGGLDSILGCIVGGFILAIGGNIAQYYVSPHLPGITGVVAPILILVVLLLKPSGLFGSKPIERV